MDDLRIVWVSGEPDDRRVGYAPAPSHSMAGDPGAGSRDLDADLHWLATNAHRLILMLDDAELAGRGLLDVVDRGQRFGFTVMRRPVDLARPVPVWLMHEIAAWRAHGPTVYADRSGNGRAAVAAAWTIVADGSTPEAAVAAVEAASRRKLSALAIARVNEFVVSPVAETLGGTPIPLPSTGLRRAHLPPPRAPWYWRLSEFALSFDGYEFSGSLNRLVDFGWKQVEGFAMTGSLPSGLTLDEARACLFFIQGVCRDRALDPTPGRESGPTTDEIRFAWALVEHIRGIIKRA